MAELGKPSRRSISRLWLLLGLVTASLVQPATAQWAKESYALKAGWNGIWLPLDCTHDDINKVVADPAVEEIWRWNPPLSNTQFTANPQTPVPGDVQWSVWIRNTPEAPFSSLFKVTGNAAYLVKVADSVGNGSITVNITGKPLLPQYNWKEAGTNLFGFSTLNPAPNFEQFLSHSPTLRDNPPVFAYLGGAGLQPIPTRVTAPRTTSVERNKAYWIKSSGYTDYSGPLKVTGSATSLEFGPEGYVASIRIKNMTAASLDATLASAASEAPPATTPPQPSIAGAVPLQVRGQFNPVTSQYAYASLPQTINLAAGEEREVVLALRRGEMGAASGSVYQSLVRVTDSLGLARIDLPASAVTTSLAGLWIGEASVDSVDQVVGNNLTQKPVTESFPLRFLVHMNGSGQSTLLQQVYLGEGQGGASIVATKQSALNQSKLANATRLSSSNLPLDLRVPNGGALGLSGSASFTVALPAGAATNPFLHIYHPDHGPAQSYPISRAIRLDFASSLPGVTDPTFGSTMLGGTYSETISGLRAVSAPATGLRVSGTFVLRRVSTISDLTIP